MCVTAGEPVPAKRCCISSSYWTALSPCELALAVMTSGQKMLPSGVCGVGMLSTALRGCAASVGEGDGKGS